MGSGGKREGSGRKPMTPGEKKVPMSLSVSPKTKELLMRRAKEMGIPPGQIIENLIK